jgi:uncharacterized protein involved in outer membrane biogenesis
MRAAKTVVLILLGVVVAVAGAIAYLPTYLEGHRNLLETYASDALGRPVHIAGNVAMAWAMRPSISVQGVRIENPHWSASPVLARAKRAYLQLDLPSLLQGRIRLARVVVEQAELRLELGPQGENNWTSPSGGRGKAGFQVNSVRVLNSTLVFQPAHGTIRRLGIERLEMIDLETRSVSLDAELSYEGIPFSVSAASGLQDSVQDERWPFIVRAQTADASMKAAGSMAAPFDIAGVEADVTLKGENLGALRKLIRQTWLPEGPFQLGLHLSRGGDAYRLSNIAGGLAAPAPWGRIAVSKGEASISANAALSASMQGTWGQTPGTVRLGLAGLDPRTPAGPRKLDIGAEFGGTGLTGALQLALDRPRPHVGGDLTFTRVDLRGWAASESVPRRTWSDGSLPLAVLRAFDADLRLRVDLATAERLQVRKLRTRAVLDDGVLRLDGLRAALPGLDLNGRATLDTRPQAPTVEVALNADRVDLPKALHFLSAPPGIAGTMQAVSLRAKAQGGTPREIVGTLRGELTAREARLEVPGAQQNGGASVRLTDPRLMVAPAQTARLQVDAALGEQAFHLDLTGGPLAGLLSPSPWPSVEVLAHGAGALKGVEVRGTIGPFPSLLAGRDLRIDLSARRPGAKVSARGTLARLDALQGAKLAVEASGDSLSSLGPPFRVELPQSLPFVAAASLEGSEHRLDVRDLKATSGEGDIQGELHIRLANRTRVEATLTSRLIDLTPYLPERGGPAHLEKAGGEPLPFDLLRVLDGSLALTAGRVRIGDFGLEDCILDATLDSGHLRVSANAGHDRLAADVDLRPEQTQWRLDLTHKGRLDLAWLIREEKAGPASKAPATLDVRLSGVGDSLRTVLGTADGHVDVVLGRGQLSRKTAGLPLGGLLVTLLDTINPANLLRQSDKLECAVLQFDLANGIATSTRGLAVQTESINAIGGGAVNLRSQGVDLRFKTVQRKGLGINLLGIAGGSISITGTLADPKVSIDPQGLVLRAGAAWATAGVSLLVDQLAKRLTAFSNPCDAVMQERGRQTQ